MSSDEGIPLDTKAQETEFGEFAALFWTLREDINQIYPSQPSENPKRVSYPSPVYLQPAQRRNLVRAVFAFTEGNAYFLRQMILRAGVGKLPTSTLFALSELQIDVTAGGIARTKTLRLSALSMLRLTVNSFAQLYTELEDLGCRGPGFEALVRSTGVRDRLMHPKSIHALTVTDTEISDLVTGFLWFEDVMREMSSAATNALRQELRDDFGLEVDIQFT
ncbi:hypothetical protein Q7L38_14925 [Pseudomonas protegens]|uniref:hypothetical protein n=1 Tax=Pseudomonas protegens TaxID=380021 RepID=UPI002774BA96|nr:hypothetical protein [Pseudomonas protegens]MDP9533866.1 hypothetical protein [Pseudomonas protegens]